MQSNRIWAEISRSRLLANYHRLRQIAAPRVDLLPVIKANAYGHGVRLCAPLLAEAGSSWLGVTGIEEGIEVRSLCPEQEILAMSGICGEEADAALAHRLTPVVWEQYHLERLLSAAERRGSRPGGVPVHLEIDTGMSRQGVRVRGDEGGAGNLTELLRFFDPPSPLRLEGVLTHFSAPEILSSTEENPQLPRFLWAVDVILSRGHRPAWLHAGNSTTLLAGADRERIAAIAARSGARAMLRPGLALYGYVDRIFRDGERLAEAGSFAELLGLAPVLAWKTRITSLRNVEAGAVVGYDNTFTARRPSRMALIPAGYADGISRHLSNCGRVLVRGRRAAIAGRVSMDQTIIDVTDIPEASIGDEVVLLGAQGPSSISAWDLADLTGSIPWEVLCAIHPRVPRIAVN